MWTITARNLFNLRGGGGEPFVLFTDDVLRCHAFFSGCPMVSVQTNQRVNIADGGVDTEIQAHFRNDNSGWFLVPTCWQYKAKEFASVNDRELKKEIGKGYARQLILRGFGYRLCICDDMPAQTKADWEEILNAEANKISPGAAPCFVLTASDLANLAKRYPALVLTHFNPNLAEALHFSAWGSSVKGTTPIYVPVPEWRPNYDRIINHVNFQIDVGDVVLPLFGDAGVGKSRLVYEALASIPGIDGLVAYTIDDTHALSLATAVANDPMLRSILIADECSPDTRERLRRLLASHKNRMRVVTIDNSPRQLAVGSALPRITQMPRQIAEEVLSQNFPLIPVDRRHRYAGLSDGFLRFASYLADHDAEISTIGSLSPAMGQIHDLIYYRMSEDERRCLDAIGLLIKVGCAGEVAHELDALCKIVGMQRDIFVEIAGRIKDGTGFVVRAGRYFYLTPELVARAAFASAWQRWAASDPNRFLDGIPDLLLETFRDRVAKSAPDDVREVVADFFKDWVARARPKDLLEEHVVDRLVALTDIDPQWILPQLRRLIEEMAVADLRKITGDFRVKWGPRRSLVWLAERLAIFPEFYHDAESILFRLANAENEPGIGNNATRIWCQLQRILLSGTATPFVDRLAVLKQRCLSVDPAAIDVTLAGLAETLETLGTRMIGPVLVAGRIPPAEWMPTSQAEYRQCVKSVVELIEGLADANAGQMRDSIVAVGINKLHVILNAGLLEEAITLLSNDRVGVKLLPQMLETLDDFIVRNQFAKSGDEFQRRIREWQQSLFPADLHGRLVAIVGIEPWHYRDTASSDAWKAKIASLALELIESPEFLLREVGWLSTSEARSAFQLGYEIAKLDIGKEYVEQIFSAAARTSATGFARGYVLGALTMDSSDERINSEIDRLERVAPLIAFDISLVGEEKTRAVERTIRLIRKGILPPQAARGLLFGGYWRRIPAHEFIDLLTLLVEAVERGQLDAAETAVTLVAYRLLDVKEGAAPPIFDKDDSQAKIAWRLLDCTLENGGKESHSWFDVLRLLSATNVERALQLACRALVSQDYHQREAAQKFLVEMATSYPSEIMIALGKALLDEQHGWHFHIDKYDELVAAIPVATVEEWLTRAGVEGARRIARHVPPPRLSEQGLPELPPLTRFLLTTFEDDERTFQEFVAGTGSHGMMWGDIAEKYESIARVADAFRNDPLRRVREWAEIASRTSRKEAEFWQAQDEEDGIP